MANRIFYFIALVGLLASLSLSAQDPKSGDEHKEKIRGTRFIPYPGYAGTPYLSDNFLPGEIEFADGSTSANIGLRYSTYRDELIYYNPVIKTQIVIDKISLKGFSFVDPNGLKRIFRRQFYTGYLRGECFFEVLSDGKISLLAYRKVDLEPCDPSYSKPGLAYQPSFSYYLYSPEKGYSAVKMNRSSLLSKFEKSDQKIVKRTLRKSKVFISNEASFIKAWDLIKDKGMVLK